MHKERYIEKINPKEVSYKLGYRWRDVNTGDEFKVVKFGYECIRIDNVTYEVKE